MNVYVKSGLQEPNPWESDIEIKGQTYVKLTSKSFPSLKAQFVAMVQVNGNAYYQNK